MPHTNTLLFALALTLAVGCDEVREDTEDTEDTAAPITDPADVPDLGVLVDAGGCSDVVFTLYAPDGALSLVFSLYTDLAEQAVSTGALQTATVDLAVEGSLVLREGTNVDWLECTDTFDDSQVVDVEWTAVSGEVVLTAEPQEGSDMPALGTITISNAVLSAEGQGDVLIPSLTWEAGVGWIAAG
jgi:uncharacterized protein YheU (UPF0270 family)